MDSYGILSALAERTITAEEAKTMTLAARSSSAQVNEASLALLLLIILWMRSKQLPVKGKDTLYFLLMRFL